MAPNGRAASCSPTCNQIIIIFFDFWLQGGLAVCLAFTTGRAGFGFSLVLDCMYGGVGLQFTDC